MNEFVLENARHQLTIKSGLSPTCIATNMALNGLFVEFPFKCSQQWKRLAGVRFRLQIRRRKYEDVWPVCDTETSGRRTKWH